MVNESTPLVNSYMSGPSTPFPNPRLLWRTGAVLGISDTTTRSSAQTCQSCFRDGCGCIWCPCYQAKSHRRSTCRLDDRISLHCTKLAVMHDVFLKFSEIFGGLGLLLLSFHPRFAYHRFAGPAIAAGSLIFSGSIFGLILDKDKQ